MFMYVCVCKILLCISVNTVAFVYVVFFMLFFINICSWFYALPVGYVRVAYIHGRLDASEKR